MKSDKFEIVNTICEILDKKIHVNPELISNENYDKLLTGDLFRISGINMTYVFFEVEKQFNITIDVNNILNYEFNTINGIANIVEDCLLSKKKCLCKIS